MIASTGELTAEARDAHKIVPNVTFRYGLGDSALFECRSTAGRCRQMDGFARRRRFPETLLFRNYSRLDSDFHANHPNSLRGVGRRRGTVGPSGRSTGLP